MGDIQWLHDIWWRQVLFDEEDSLTPVSKWTSFLLE